MPPDRRMNDTSMNEESSEVIEDNSESVHAEEWNNHPCTSSSNNNRFEEDEHHVTDTNTDDDDESLHDLDSVMALAAAQQTINNLEGSNSSLLPLVFGSTLSASVEEESKEEISDVPSQRNNNDDIPRNFAETCTAAEQATVLEEDKAVAATWNNHNYQEETDERLALAAAEEEELMLALKRSLYEGGGNFNQDYQQQPSHNQQHDAQEATIVEISDNSMNGVATAIHAEWVGQDYNHQALQSAQTSLPSSSHGTETSAEVVEQDDGAATQEAMVIDSAPVEKDEPMGFTEEAQVLFDNTQNDSGNNISENNNLDQKPAATNRSSSRRYRQDREAEVVSIQEREDIHPLERRRDVFAPRAELVGTDASVAIAVPSTGAVSSTAETAMVTSEPSSSAQSQNTHTSTSTPEVTAIIDTAASRSHIAATSTVAAPVASEENSPFCDEYDLYSDSPPEQAQVLVEDEIGNDDDRKPAAVDQNLLGSPAREYQARRCLSAIAEQEGEVLSMQELQDIHPLDRAEQRYEESEAELIALDPTVSLGVSLNRPPSLSLPMATSDVLSTGNGSISDLCATLVNQYENRVEGDQVISADVDTLRNSAELEQDAGITICDVGDDRVAEIALSDGSTVTQQTSATMEVAQPEATTSITQSEAEVVEIRHAEDIHPMEQEEQHAANAQLVGTATETFCSPLHSSSSNIHVASIDGSQAEELAEAQTIGVVSMETIDDNVGMKKHITDSSRLGATPPGGGSNLTLSAAMDDGYAAALASLDGRTELAETSENTQTSSDARRTTNSPDIPPMREDPYSDDWLRVSSPDDSPPLGHFDSNQRNNIGVTVQTLSNNIARSTSNVIEALFGDTPRRSSPSDNQAAIAIRPRSLLPWSVFRSSTSEMWIVTLQTNQRALDKNDVTEASKSLRAFSMPSEKQAICLGKAWTPPRMLPFAKYKNCHICKAKFAIFKRACHCRNCGVCICKDCAVQWPSKMIPDTYNIKKEYFVNVCKSCNWLCNAFRLALLEGNRDQAVALHATGNINLHTPFANVKGELFYPVHCAVLGGNLKLLSFLVDEHSCPIRSVRVAGTASANDNYVAILTSKGRSLLGIALENGYLDIVRYLVVDKNVSLSGEKDITPDMLCRNFAKLLHMTSSSFFQNETSFQSSRPSVEQPDEPLDESSATNPPPTAPEYSSFIEAQRTLSDEARDFGAVDDVHVNDKTHHKRKSAKEECIICFDRLIDCVATPCGHQICCLECSEQLSSRCPVCSCNCSFMRVFKA